MVVALGAAASSVASSLTGGLIHGSTLNASLASVQGWYTAAQNGNQDAVNRLTRYAGLAGGVGIAPQAEAKNAAKQAIRALLDAGIITGPSGSGPYGLPDGIPNLTYTVVRKAGSTSDNTPPGPGGDTTDNPKVPALVGSLPTWAWVGLAVVLGWFGLKYLKRGG